MRQLSLGDYQVSDRFGGGEEDAGGFRVFDNRRQAFFRRLLTCLHPWSALCLLLRGARLKRAGFQKTRFSGAYSSLISDFACTLFFHQNLPLRPRTCFCACLPRAVFQKQADFRLCQKEGAYCRPAAACGGGVASKCRPDSRARIAGVF